MISCHICSFPCTGSSDLVNHYIQTHFLLGQFDPTEFYTPYQPYHTPYHQTPIISHLTPNNQTTPLSTNPFWNISHNMSAVPIDVDDVITHPVNTQVNELMRELASIPVAQPAPTMPVQQTPAVQPFPSSPNPSHNELDVIMENYRSNFCPSCEITVDDLDTHFWLSHPEYYNGVQVGRGLDPIPVQRTRLVHGNAVVSYKAELDNVECDDVTELLANLFPSVEKILLEELEQRKNFKLLTNCQIKFYKLKPDGDREETIAWFNTFVHNVLHKGMIQRIWTLIASEYETRVEDFTCERSGWIVDRIMDFGFTIGTYRLLGGASYIPLPWPLNKKLGLLNIENRDDKCFLYSVIAHQKLGSIPQDKHHNHHRYNKKVSSYAGKQHLINQSGLVYPMTLNQLQKFEKNNPHISITVLGYDCDNKEEEEDEGNSSKASKMRAKKVYNVIRKNLCLLHNSPAEQSIHVDLLLLMEDGKEHFVLIQDLEAFLRPPNQKYRRQICRNCLNGFTTIATLTDHKKYCLKVQNTSFPWKPLKFDHYDRTQPLAFRLHADFEAVLEPIHEMLGDATIKIQKHIPCGYSWNVIDHLGQLVKSKVYRTQDPGENVAVQFIKDLVEECDELSDVIKVFQEEAESTMVVDPQLMKEEVRKNQCCFCQKPMPGAQAKHHSHLPPFSFIGLAHIECNLNARLRPCFPVFIHNLAGYDMHFLIRAITELKQAKVVKEADIIATSSEKFMTLCINKSIRFLDSFKFTTTGLEKLVSTMAKDGHLFPITRQEFGNHPQIDLLFRKASYPYSYVTSLEKFKETELPPIEAFFNDLTEEPLSMEAYAHMQEVWRVFELKNLGDLHDLYVRLDTALLSDVMEKIHSLMLESYGLEIGHYFSLPMLAFDGLLKMSDVTLDLIDDPTLHCWIEASIRGGYVGIGQLRAAKSNNKYMGAEYDETQPSSYILYIDANNLYGYAMSQYLPTGGFKWIGTNICEEQVLGIDPEGEFGYTFEVDLDIPEELHDKLDSFPPCPEPRLVGLEEVSCSYQQLLMEDLDVKLGKCKKLVADLNHKRNYIVQYRALQSYLKLGVKISKVHKALRYDQSPWMKPYIDSNTEKRKLATSDFEKNFWKLLNNAAFGKTIEQKRNRQNINIVTSEDQAIRLLKKPTVQNIIPIDDQTSLFVMKRVSIHLDKPIYVGSSVLDLAKSVMYDFHYDVMQRKYGNNAQLVYTDTDSLIYRVQTDDVYEDMLGMKDAFDMSEYPPKHPLFGRFHDPSNKKVLGKFKDEFAGSVITHIAAPKSKMYGIRSLAFEQKSGGTFVRDADGNFKTRVVESKKCKGIGKSAVEQNLPLGDYARVLVESVQTYADMKTIRSEKHQLYTMQMRKKCLNGLCYKRFIVDSVSSLAHGNKNICLYE